MRFIEVVSCNRCHDLVVGGLGQDCLLWMCNWSVVGTPERTWKAGGCCSRVQGSGIGGRTIGGCSGRPRGGRFLTLTASGEFGVTGEPDGLVDRASALAEDGLWCAY